MTFWQQTLDMAQQYRHDLHRHPELGWQEHRTADRIRTALSEWNIPWKPCADTGTLGFLAPHQPGPALALRGDMDALPIVEKSDVPWQSQHDGCMHACGHDGHTATLLAAARWLKRHEAELPQPVTLVFQPAEEGGHGALRMIEDGALEGVGRIFGWHNWPAIPFGKMACPGGIVMCGNGTFEIELQGQGGHASQPESCRDPVLAASAITLALQQIVSRRLPPQTTAVVSVASIEAPSAPTVIPESARLGGSIRVPDPATRAQVNEAIVQIAEATAASYGVSASVSIHPRYEATINTEVEAATARSAWTTLFGESNLNQTVAMPVMASEDFSYYLQRIPGAFALIGAGEGQRQQVPCHSPYYDFNDQLIEPVTRYFAYLTGAPLPS